MSPTAYLRIVQSLEADIRTGRLRADDPVPSQRTAARHWQVATATVTRAYAEAVRRGLLVARPGSVTRVAGHITAEPVGHLPAAHNLADNIPLAPTALNGEALLRQAFDALAQGRAHHLLSRTDQASDLPAHLDALTAWLGALGVPIDAGQTVLPSPGAQVALLVALRCTAMHRAVACEPLVNPGMIAAAQFLGITLRPLACDGDGPLPDALAAAVAQGAAALYASPTCSNPLARHWSPSRREALAAVARAHDLWLIEDDDLRPLAAASSMPLAGFAAERTISIVGSSKLAGFALRTAAVAVPGALGATFAAQLRAAVWMASPLLVDVLAQWQAGGQLGALAAARRAEAAAIQRLAQAALGRFGYRGHACALHGWLPLARPWDSERLAFHAARRGIAITPARAFAPTGRVPAGLDGVRLSWSAGADTAAALAGLVHLLEHGPAATPA